MEAGVEAGAAAGLEPLALNARTSSFSTRPSFPVPWTWWISMPNSLMILRTAGVAKEACFPGSEVCGAGVDADVVED